MLLNKAEYHLRVVLQAPEWLTVRRFESTAACIAALKEQNAVVNPPLPVVVVSIVMQRGRQHFRSRTPC